MKFNTSVVTLALAAGAFAAPQKDWSKVTGPVEGLLLTPDTPGPASQYAIGKNPGPFAKVDGRLFVLNGKKQYFSGE